MTGTGSASSSRSSGAAGREVGGGPGGLDGAAPEDRVELSVPADPAYLAVLRTATAGLAARADMTIDEIEDLRIAVDEACALVLGDDVAEPPAGATLDAVFLLEHQVMVVRVAGPTPDLPERSSFAWSVLEALVDALDAGTTDDGRRSITLRHGSRRAA